MQEYRSIELNVKVGCPVACLYCPQDKFTKSDFGSKRSLQRDDLKKILDNLTYDSTSSEVFFAGMSEPFSHNQCIDLIEDCNNHSFINRVVVFTTGYKITEEQIEKLANFRKIKLNLHIGKKDTMPNFDDKILGKLINIKEKLPNSDFINVGFERNYELESHLEQQGIELKFQQIISRAGNLSSVGDKIIYEKTIKSPVTCPRVNDIKRPVILPDGTALACANDYSCELKIGNLLNATWEHLDFEKIRKLQKNPCNLPCFRDCHYAVKLPINKNIKII